MAWPHSKLHSPLTTDMRKLGLLTIFVITIICILTAHNWTKLKRLHTINTLFDADKIVHNFSNMDTAFLSQSLPAATPKHIWPTELSALPESIRIYDQQTKLETFIAETDTTALLVIKDGHILSETYYKGTDKEDLRISWSVAKSFMSILFGVAIENGDIASLQDSVDSYVPALKTSAYAGIPIRHVLNMSSGITFNEDYLDPKSDINKMGRVLGLGSSMDKFTQNLTARDRASGTARQYISIDTHVLAMVLRAATGKSLHQLFKDTYSAHLGFGKTPYYLTDGKNVAFALGGLNLRTRDYALFGQMILQKGMWRGEQIVPENWIIDATKDSAPQPDIDDSGLGYGYQWWVPYDSAAQGGDFLASGIYGQFIYINPAANMVIAKNSAHRQFLQNGQSGQSYKLETIEMFRALTRHYTP